MKVRQEASGPELAATAAEKLRSAEENARLMERQMRRYERARGM